MTWTPPDEGLCAVCEETVPLRRDGRTPKHDKPYDPDGPIGLYNRCLGAEQQPAIRLDMTFARWLRAHHKRRDARDNPITFLAQRVFQACSRTPAKTVAELSWSTVEELRLLLVQPRVNEWIAAYLDQAEAAYGAYQAVRMAGQ